METSVIITDFISDIRSEEVHLELSDTDELVTHVRNFTFTHSPSVNRKG